MVIYGYAILLQIGRLGRYAYQVSTVVFHGLVCFVGGCGEVKGTTTFGPFRSPSQRDTSVDSSIATSLDFVSSATRASTSVFTIWHANGALSSAYLANAEHASGGRSKAVLFPIRYRGDGLLSSAFFSFLGSVVVFVGGLFYPVWVGQYGFQVLPKGANSGVGVIVRGPVFVTIFSFLLRAVRSFIHFLANVFVRTKFLSLFFGDTSVKGIFQIRLVWFFLGMVSLLLGYDLSMGLLLIAFLYLLYFEEGFNRFRRFLGHVLGRFATLATKVYLGGYVFFFKDGIRVV